MNPKKSAMIAAMLVLGLAGCSRSNEESAPAQDQGEAIESSAPVAVETPALPDPQANAADANLTAEAPPAVPPAPDEQMMDDASATGMTARTTRGENDEEAVPADQAERK